MKVFTALVGATGAFAMHYSEPKACAETISYGISKVADSMLGLRDHHSALDIISSLKDTYAHTKGLHEVVDDCKKIALLPGIPTPKILPGVPTPERDDGLLPGVVAPQKILDGVPTPKWLDDGKQKILDGVPTPKWVDDGKQKILDGVPTPKWVDDGKLLPGVPTPPKIISGVPTPKYLEKNATVQNECLEDIKAVMDDALDAASLIEEATKAKSVEDVIEAMKEVRKVESDLTEVKAACTCGNVKAEVLRSPCAKKLEFAMGQLYGMEKDIKAAIDGDIMRAFAVEHEITRFPILALEVKKACLVTDIEAEAIKMLKHSQARRDFGWGFVDKLKKLVSTTSTKIQKETAKAACFGSSMSIVKDIKGLAGTIGESIKNMTLHGMQDASHLHSHVSNAIVSCQQATTA